MLRFAATLLCVLLLPLVLLPSTSLAQQTTCSDPVNPNRKIYDLGSSLWIKSLNLDHFITNNGAPLPGELARAPADQYIVYRVAGTCAAVLSGYWEVTYASPTFEVAKQAEFIEVSSDTMLKLSSPANTSAARVQPTIPTPQVPPNNPVAININNGNFATTSQTCSASPQPLGFPCWNYACASASDPTCSNVTNVLSLNGTGSRGCVVANASNDYVLTYSQTFSLPASDVSARRITGLLSVPSSTSQGLVTAAMQNIYTVSSMKKTPSTTGLDPFNLTPGGFVGNNSSFAVNFVVPSWTDPIVKFDIAITIAKSTGSTCLSLSGLSGDSGVPAADNPKPVWDALADRFPIGGYLGSTSGAIADYDQYARNGYNIGVLGLSLGLAAYQQLDGDLQAVGIKDVAWFSNPFTPPASPGNDISWDQTSVQKIAQLQNAFGFLFYDEPSGSQSTINYPAMWSGINTRRQWVASYTNLFNIINDNGLGYYPLLILSNIWSSDFYAHPFWVNQSYRSMYNIAAGRTPLFAVIGSFKSVYINALASIDYTPQESTDADSHPPDFFSRDAWLLGNAYSAIENNKRGILYFGCQNLSFADSNANNGCLDRSALLEVTRKIRSLSNVLVYGSRLSDTNTVNLKLGAYPAQSDSPVRWSATTYDFNRDGHDEVYFLSSDVGGLGGSISVDMTMFPATASNVWCRVQMFTPQFVRASFPYPSLKGVQISAGSGSPAWQLTFAPFESQTYRFIPKEDEDFATACSS